MPVHASGSLFERGQPPFPNLFLAQTRVAPTIRLAVAALYPAFNGVTLAGAVGTAAHGSSLVFPSALGSAVVAAEVVNSDGAVVNVTGGDELAAVQSHLGVLGVGRALPTPTLIHASLRPFGHLS